MLRLITALVATLSLTACVDQLGTPSTASGAAIGAGTGAVAGQVIGGDTKSTLIGTVIGAGIGAAAANQQAQTAQPAVRVPASAQIDPCAGITGDHEYDLCMDRNM